MNRSIVKMGSGSSNYSFEQFPDETQDEYQLFVDYCKADTVVTPAEFLFEKAPQELIIKAQMNGWMQRRDNFYKWMDTQRRQLALRVLDKHLSVVTSRLPYLIKREDRARMIESKLMDETGNVKFTAALRRSVDETNKNIDLLLRVVKALEPASSLVNVTNTAMSISGEASDRIAKMQQQWGDPEVSS